MKMAELGTVTTSIAYEKSSKTRSLLNLLFASVYADGEIGTVIDMEIKSGYWVDDAGNPHEFNFEGGGDLNDYELPPMPSGSHSCTLGDDCICEVAKMSLEEKKQGPEYQRFKDTTDAEFMTEFGAIENWVDFSTWGNADWQKVKTKPDGEKIYQIADSDGWWFDISDIWYKSDALMDAIMTTVTEYNKYMEKCREAYLKINTCDNKKPQHQWVSYACGSATWKVCDRNAGHKEGSESHSGWRDAGSGIHKCACGVESQEHGPWTEWEESSRVGGVIVYKRTCTVCGCEDVKLVENMTCVDKLDFHVAHSDTCGCQCGKYGKGGEASSDKNLHKWSEQTDGNGIRHCMCKCGRFHEQRAATAYMVNQDKVCGGVCAYCREKAGTGLDIGKAADTLHTPNEPKDGTCGCKCGALDHTSTHEMFHIQKPGSCCCLGADGNGGSWHFQMEETEACSKICADRTSFGGPHLRASSAKENSVPRKAQVSDHDKYDGYSCGCECREYNHSNYAKWTSVGNLHNGNPNRCGCYCGHASESQIVPYHKKASETDCECECEEHIVISHVWADGSCYCNCRYHDKKHQKKNSGKCTAVCHGGCGEASDPAKKGSHTPSTDRCGCECGMFSGQSYKESAYGDFHIEPPNGGCECPCGEKHFFEGAPNCPNVCQWCEMDITREKWGAEIHSFGNRCVCACSKFARGHVLGDPVEVRREPGSCEICMSENIEVVVYERKCQRECDYKKEYYEEEGHIDDLHDEEDQLVHCERHGLWYRGSCPMCDDEDNGEDDGNNGNNGGGSETGGDDDPVNIIFNPSIPAINF